MTDISHTQPDQPTQSDLRAGSHVIVPKGTAVTSQNTGKARRTSKGLIAEAQVIEDGIIMWLTVNGDWREANLNDVHLVEGGAPHRADARSSIRGGSPVRGGGTLRMGTVNCTCGWSARRLTSVKEAREAHLDHVIAVAQISSWGDEAELVVEMPGPNSWSPNPFTVTGWTAAVELLGTLSTYEGRNVVVHGGVDIMNEDGGGRVYVSHLGPAYQPSTWTTD